jgi:hypothetical protein
VVRVCQPRQRTVAAIEVTLFALGAFATLLGGAFCFPSESSERGTMANVHPIASTKDTAAEFARLATLDFAPWTGGSRVTSETWKKTFMAAQIALAVMERSKKGLTSAIAEDSMAFDATFDQLTFHADFLDEVANLLRTAQARLLIAAAASVHRQAA